jgi:hypothetical protein
MEIIDYIRTVFYAVKGNIVEIRRILHGKRRYSFLFDPK